MTSDSDPSHPAAGAVEAPFSYRLVNGGPLNPLSLLCYPVAGCNLGGIPETQTCLDLFTVLLLTVIILRAPGSSCEPSSKHVCHCGKAFIRKEHLRRHQATHGERNFTCSLCQRSFTRK